MSRIGAVDFLVGQDPAAQGSRRWTGEGGVLTELLLPLIFLGRRQCLSFRRSHPLSEIMETAGKSVEELQTKILRLEEELNELKKELTEAQSREQSTEDVEKGIRWKWPLKADEYERYGRQLILPHVGIKGLAMLHSPSTRFTRANRAIRRPTPAEVLICPRRGRRRTRLPGCRVPCRRWYRNHWDSGR